MPRKGKHLHPQREHADTYQIPAKRDYGDSDTHESDGGPLPSESGDGQQAPYQVRWTNPCFASRAQIYSLLAVRVTSESSGASQ